MLPDIIPADPSVSDNELLKFAAAVEEKSEHPLARAIIRKAKEEKIEPEEVTDFSAVVGNGLKGVLRGNEIAAGNLKFIEKTAEISDDIRKIADELSKEGKTPLFLQNLAAFLE